MCRIGGNILRFVLVKILNSLQKSLIVGSVSLHLGARFIAIVRVLDAWNRTIMFGREILFWSCRAQFWIGGITKLLNETPKGHERPWSYSRRNVKFCKDPEEIWDMYSGFDNYRRSTFVVLNFSQISRIRAVSSHLTFFNSSAPLTITKALQVNQITSIGQEMRAKLA